MGKYTIESAIAVLRTVTPAIYDVDIELDVCQKPSGRLVVQWIVRAGDDASVHGRTFDGDSLKEAVDACLAANCPPPADTLAAVDAAVSKVIGGVS